MNHPYLTSTLFAASSMLVGAPAMALSIDTFFNDDDNAQVVASLAPGSTSTNSFIGTTHALGGSRQLGASNGTGDFGTLGIVSDGLLRYSNTSDSAGSLFTAYITNGADLTDGGASTGFLFTVEFADAPVDMEIELTAGVVSSVTTTLPDGISGTGDAQEVFIPFANLSGTPDLTDVDLIIVDFTPTNGAFGADLTISNLRTGVPEPSSLALLALGGLAMMRRRRA